VKTLKQDFEQLLKDVIKSKAKCSQEEKKRRPSPFVALNHIESYLEKALAGKTFPLTKEEQVLKDFNSLSKEKKEKFIATITGK